ncbi:MAG: hypothetical protein JRJ58_01165 [Deltaproteobacteria bacterium]|nr:hypothetical protein [Deltaproteobacteria bacterium]
MATPIGNIEDVTLRALRVLREADRVLIEDTTWKTRLLEAQSPGSWSASPSMTFAESM